MKILANATSYGIFIELNSNEMPARVGKGYGNGNTCACTPARSRRAGPLLSPVSRHPDHRRRPPDARPLRAPDRDSGLESVVCDTDSMAIARPPGMAEATFHAKGQRDPRVVCATQPLSRPNAGRAIGAEARRTRTKPSDACSHAANGDPSYCFVVSPKRYVMFNRGTKGRPILRKASAHGLGHLRDPYGGVDGTSPVPAPARAIPELGVVRWQYDVWLRILQAALGRHAEIVRLADLPNFMTPAAAVTPQPRRPAAWFHRYNRGKPYREQVRPFEFLLAFRRSA